MSFIKSFITIFLIVFLIEGLFFYRSFGIKEVFFGFVIGLIAYFIYEHIIKK